MGGRSPGSVHYSSNNCVVPHTCMCYTSKTPFVTRGNVEYLTLGKYEFYIKTSWVVDYGCGFLVKYCIDYFNNQMPL